MNKPEYTSIILQYWLHDMIIYSSIKKSLSIGRQHILILAQNNIKSGAHFTKTMCMFGLQHKKLTMLCAICNSNIHNIDMEANIQQLKTV